VDKICERAVRYFADPHRKVQHMHSQRTIVLVAGLVFFARNVWTQESNAQQSQSVEVGSREANDTNAANNPIHPLLTVDLQNYFAPSPKGFSGRIGNQGLLRVAVPIRAFGTRQIVRTILPINTTASMQGGPNTGAGDLTVYDFLLFQEHRSTLGIGPLIAAPTARGEAYGSGKWQAGAAGIVIAPHNCGLLAVLATYQHSFSGNSSSPVGQLTSVQPFFIDNFPHGFYFRSTGVWTFDTFHHVQNIPSTLLYSWATHPEAWRSLPAGSCLHPARSKSTGMSCSSWP